MKDESIYKSAVYDHTLYTITDYLLPTENLYFVNKELVDTTFKNNKIFYLYKSMNFGVPYPFSETVIVSVFNQYFPDIFKINQ